MTRTALAAIILTLPLALMGAAQDTQPDIRRPGERMDASHIRPFQATYEYTVQPPGGPVAFRAKVHMAVHKINSAGTPALVLQYVMTGAQGTQVGMTAFDRDTLEVLWMRATSPRGFFVVNYIDGKAMYSLTPEDGKGGVISKSVDVSGPLFEYTGFGLALSAMKLQDGESFRIPYFSGLTFEEVAYAAKVLPEAKRRDESTGETRPVQPVSIVGPLGKFDFQISKEAPYLLGTDMHAPGTSTIVGGMKLVHWSLLEE